MFDSNASWITKAFFVWLSLRLWGPSPSARLGMTSVSCLRRSNLDAF
ncbi:MAG: hypothetical protein QOH88_655 [Verrucomicrobiota bacterium]|jgi:hypothetical protein